MPPNMESSKLFAELTSLPRPHRLVPFPRINPKTGEEFQVGMWLLTQNEAMLVAAEAEKTARRLLRDNLPGRNESSKGYDDVYNNASAIELLYRACRDPEHIERPFFPSKQAISDVLTVDEIAILLNHYFTLQVEIGPIVGAMTNDELQAWLEKLAEGGQSSQYFLNSLSLEALKGLLIALAVQLHSSQTDKSLSMSPPEKNTSNQPQKKPAKSKTSDKNPEDNTPSGTS